MTAALAPNMQANERTPLVDEWLLATFVLLAVMGLVMMGSASMEYASQQYDNPFYHVMRHTVFLGIGLTGTLIFACVPMRFWEKYSGVLLALGFLSLVLVLIPGIGHVVNGSRRWISLGVLNLQCSELIKIAVVLYIAAYLVRREDEVRLQWRGFIKPLVVMSGLIVLLLLEPDFGAVVVVLGAVLGMLFLGGVRLTQFFVVILVSLVAIGLMATLAPYRLKRMATFVDPWPHQFDSGYQLVQSLIAFGRGEWFGLGLGRSVQKMFYLPEAHTDFVFAIVGEELGFVGALAVIVLFAVLIGRMLVIGRRAERLQQKFSAYVCYGVALIFGGQTFINMGVNAGLLPTKGLTLPFFSYGGSSLLVSCVLVGLVLRVAIEIGSDTEVVGKESQRFGIKTR
ncbi:MAG: putative lipid II flippase FtsW [Pseudomonadales bacterium]